MVLFRVSTGERLERWSVDARGMVASGEFTETPPAGAAPEPASVPAQPVLPPPVPVHPLSTAALVVPSVVTHSYDAPPSPQSSPRARRR